MKDSIIIVSGGMDSITLLYDKKDEIALGISFDYGSNHNAKEIPFAKMHCERLGIKHITIPLDFMGKHFKSSLLEGSDSIPEGHYAEENMKRSEEHTSELQSRQYLVCRLLLEKKKKSK